MTPEELDELAELEAKATKGEWPKEPAHCEDGGWCASGPYRECEGDEDTDEPLSPCHQRAVVDQQLARMLVEHCGALIAAARRVVELEEMAGADRKKEFLIAQRDDAENAAIGLRGLLTAATARAEALEVALQALHEAVDDNKSYIDDRSTRRDVDDALKAAESALSAARGK